MNVQVCFPAGTPVVMADGTTRTIENILPGDKVKAVAHQSPNGEIVTGRVVRIFRNAPQMLCHLHFGTFEIRATHEHPFYVKDKGWIAAEDLKVGDVCRSASGNDVVLLYIDYESEDVPVFNFEVEGCHTYFVGENAKQSVLVHNACTNLSCGHSSCEWQRHLYEIGYGLQTSGKSFANGISGAVVSVTNLNFYAYDGPFEMNDWDKCYGGETSQVIIQGSAELGFAAVTGGTASVAKSSPKVLRYGANAVNAFDAAGNAVGVGQSASHIIETGTVSFQDGAQLVGSGLGLAGNRLPVLKSIPTKILKLGDDIKKWLGPNSRMITNEAGDRIFQSADGMHEVRFDFNKFHPHDKPHIHVIEYEMQKNKKISIIDERFFFEQ